VRKTSILSEAKDRLSILSEVKDQGCPRGKRSDPRKGNKDTFAPLSFIPRLRLSRGLH
jgi:hypothetical protein